jgi:hypothetical protein
MRVFGLVLIFCAIGCAQSQESKPVTWTGWFADDQCARGRVSSGLVTRTNPDCAKTCLEKGATPVFISEQAKAMFIVKNYSAIIENLGYQLEVTGTVDESANTISIQTVKRISEYEGAACARPKKKP